MFVSFVDKDGEELEEEVEEYEVDPTIRATKPADKPALPLLEEEEEEEQ